MSGRTVRPPISGIQDGTTSPQGRTSPTVRKARNSASPLSVTRYAVPQPGVLSSNTEASSPLKPTGMPTPRASRQSPDGTVVQTVALAASSAQRGVPSGRTARLRAAARRVAAGVPGVLVPGPTAPTPATGAVVTGAVVDMVADSFPAGPRGRSDVIKTGRRTGVAVSADRAVLAARTGCGNVPIGTGGDL